jgi:hypothetical protein
MIGTSSEQDSFDISTAYCKKDYKEGHMAQVTSQLYWIAAFITAIIDVVFVTFLAWHIRLECFHHIKNFLAGSAVIFWACLWTWVMTSRFIWETCYQYIFPSSARWIMPPAMALLDGVLALLFWWLALRLPGNPVVNLVLLGGLESFPGHLYAVKLGILATPLLKNVSAASALTFGFFEFVFYWAVILAIATIFFSIREKLAGHRIPHFALWQNLLREMHGEVEAERLIQRVQTRYEELYSRRPHHTHRALRMHLEKHILPGLALYQVLKEETGNQQQTALSDLDRILGAPATSSTRKQLSLLCHLPAQFRIFRIVARWQMCHNFPVDGWPIDQVVDDGRQYSFNIHRCFYLDTLTAYGAPELTEHFCSLDDLAMQSLPPSIRWSRTSTLARGGKQCDFRWSCVAANNKKSL